MPLVKTMNAVKTGPHNSSRDNSNRAGTPSADGLRTDHIARYNPVRSHRGPCEDQRHTPILNTPVFMCLCRGTLILTDQGEMPVERLRPGDMVMTRDNGPQPLRWTGSQLIDTAMLQNTDLLRPIRIRAGALGQGLPLRDLRVSHQHRILIRSNLALDIFGQPEVLVAAKHLTCIAGVEIDHDTRMVEYFHILFDRHEIISSEGALTESLFTSPEALNAVGPEARAEITALFPELLDRSYKLKSARLIGTGPRRQQLVRMHSESGQDLQQTQPH